GGGNRHQPVRALDHAAPGRHWPARETLGAQQVNADGNSDNFGNAVKRPDFMEVDLLEPHTMGSRFRLRKAGTYPQRPLLLGVGKVASTDYFLDLRQKSVAGFFGRLDSYESGGEASLADFFHLHADGQLQR